MAEGKRIELPSGGWAQFKDASTLRVRDRKKIIKHSNTETGIMAALNMVDGILACLITEWSFEMPIPAIKLAALEELTMADYDSLSEQAEEAQRILFPKLSETDETLEDPDSPFADSKG